MIWVLIWRLVLLSFFMAVGDTLKANQSRNLSRSAPKNSTEYYNDLMQNQNIEKKNMFFRDPPPKSPRKCPKRDDLDRKWTKSEPKVDRKLDFLEKRDQGVENYYAHRIVTCQNIERLKCKL